MVIGAVILLIIIIIVAVIASGGGGGSGGGPSPPSPPPPPFDNCGERYIAVKMKNGDKRRCIRHYDGVYDDASPTFDSLKKCIDGDGTSNVTYDPQDSYDCYFATNTGQMPNGLAHYMSGLGCIRDDSNGRTCQGPEDAKFTYIADLENKHQYDVCGTDWKLVPKHPSPGYECMKKYPVPDADDLGVVGVDPSDIRVIPAAPPSLSPHNYPFMYDNYLTKNAGTSINYCVSQGDDVVKDIFESFGAAGNCYRQKPIDSFSTPADKPCGAFADQLVNSNVCVYDSTTGKPTKNVTLLSNYKVPLMGSDKVGMFEKLCQCADFNDLDKNSAQAYLQKGTRNCAAPGSPVDFANPNAIHIDNIDDWKRAESIPKPPGGGNHLLVANLSSKGGVVGIQKAVDTPAVMGGGFFLPPSSYVDVPLPTENFKAGRVWMRTGCKYTEVDPGDGYAAGVDKILRCDAGDCRLPRDQYRAGSTTDSKGGGLYGVQCGNEVGGDPPVTLAEITVDQNGKAFYDLSMVDGLNVQSNMFALKEGCNSVTCPSAAITMCPEMLKVTGTDNQLTGCQSICKALDDQGALIRNPTLQKLRKMKVKWMPTYPAMSPVTHKFATATPGKCEPINDIVDTFGQQITLPAYNEAALTHNPLPPTALANRKRPGRWVPDTCDWNGQDCKYLKDMLCCGAGYNENIDNLLTNPNYVEYNSGGGVVPPTFIPIKGVPDLPDPCPDHTKYCTEGPTGCLYSQFNASAYVANPIGGPANPKNNCNFQMSRCFSENWPVPKELHTWCGQQGIEDSKCNFAYLFHESCPEAYSWQFDDLTAGQACDPPYGSFAITFDDSQ